MIDRFLDPIKLELRSQRWSMPKIVTIGAVVKKPLGFIHRYTDTYIQTFALLYKGLAD